MSLFLKPKQVCPFSTACPYNNSTNSFCKGADSTRESIFTCDFVTEQGAFIENKYRSKHDETGKMKVIQE